MGIAGLQTIVKFHAWLSLASHQWGLCKLVLKSQSRLSLDTLLGRPLRAFSSSRGGGEGLFVFE